MYSAEVTTFDMKLGRKDKYDIEGFLQDSERIQAVY